MTFRAHIFHGSKRTYTIPIKWNSRTSIDALAEQLKAGGYGDNSKFAAPEESLKTDDKTEAP